MSTVAWVGRVQGLVREAVDQAPDHGDQRRLLARVAPDSTRGPGWFAVQSRLSPAELESITDGRLEPAQNPGTLEHDVLEVLVSGEQAWVRTAVTAPAEVLHLYVSAADQRRTLLGLANGLETAQDRPLLGNFAARALTPVVEAQDLPAVPGWADLRPAQQRAVAACCSPGLQVVWGPPATGKTQVIAAAISHLARTGRRVLLVSATPVAVDSALERVIRLRQPGPGEMLRVGGIHRPGLTDDEQVNLARLVEEHQGEDHRRLAALAGRLQRLTGATEKLTRAQTEIGDFDVAGYRQASRRVANQSALERQQLDLIPAESDVAGAREEQISHDRLLLALDHREAVERQARARSGLTAVEATLARLERNLWMKIWNLPLVRQFRGTRSKLMDEQDRAVSAVTLSLQKAREAGGAPDACGERSRAEIEVGHGSAVGRLKAAQTRLTDLRRELSRLSTLDLARPGDQQRVTEQWPTWALHNTLPRLKDLAEQEQQQREPIEREYHRGQAQLRLDRRKIEARLVSRARVVATTPAQLALRPWITTEPFDHVIVDEAAATAFPLLVHAVGQATRGAVLIGDPLQNEPIVDEDFRGGTRVQELFRTDCFRYFGITEPAEARTRPGCVVLTEQFGVGPTFTELANRGAYTGLLSNTGAEQAEIVVVTVDDLPAALRTVQRSDRSGPGWWTIGALLGRALAEQHHGSASSNAFGIVVPYPAQAEATRAALEGAGPDLSRTPVGTPDTFQGNRFDTVLADLVEDGNGRLAATKGLNLDSARAFAMATTRARRRLYILLTNHALQNSNSAPLNALREMIATGAARQFNAGHLLGLTPAPVPPPGTAEADLVAALQPYVRKTFSQDEDSVVEEVLARIGRATTSIWCWSAWDGRYAVAIADALAHAHRRGVDVQLIARPPDQVPTSNRRSVEALVNRFPQVIFMRDLDQRIVITDRHWSTVGMKQLLFSSRNPQPLDYMIALESPKFAEQLLIQEMADELVRNRRCPQCDEPLRECRATGREPGRHWFWRCPNHHETPFPTRYSRRH